MNEAEQHAYILAGMMLNLTDDQRLQILGIFREMFCVHCGTKTPEGRTCYCSIEDIND